MPWREEIGAGVPPPREPELASLRRDILDELADHLGCAMERELRRTDDEAEARGAVLERFGDPAAVARRLYFEAIGGHIMMQKIALATNLIVAAVCVTLVIFTWTALRQNRELQQAMLARLEALAVTTDMDSPWTALEVEVTMGEEAGPPVPNVVAAVIGDAYRVGEQLTLRERTDSQGLARWDRLLPGKYFLQLPSVEFTYTSAIVAAPGRTNRSVVAWPRMTRSDVELSFAGYDMARIWRSVPGGRPMDFDVSFIHLVVTATQRQASGTWTRDAMELLVAPDGRVVPTEDPLSLELSSVSPQVTIDHVIHRLPPDWESDPLEYEFACVGGFVSKDGSVVYSGDFRPSAPSRAMKPPVQGPWRIELDDDFLKMVLYRLHNAVTGRRG